MRKLNPKRRWYVYALYREDGTPFYIGKGTGARIDAHECEVRRGEVRGNRDKYDIIKTILASGKKVEKRYIGVFTSAKAASKFEVRMIKELGDVLVNKTPGGELGRSGMKSSDETRKKISAALKGKAKSAVARSNMSNAAKLRGCDPAKIEAMRQATVGRPLSKEHRKKISDVKKGRPLSAEHVAALRGLKRSDEARANMSAAWHRSHS